MTVESTIDLPAGTPLTMDFGPDRTDGQLLLDYGVLDTGSPKVRPVIYRVIICVDALCMYCSGARHAIGCICVSCVRTLCMVCSGASCRSRHAICCICVSCVQPLCMVCSGAICHSRHAVGCICVSYVHTLCLLGSAATCHLSCALNLPVIACAYAAHLGVHFCSDLT